MASAATGPAEVMTAVRSGFDASSGNGLEGPKEARPACEVTSGLPLSGTHPVASIPSRFLSQYPMRMDDKEWGGTRGEKAPKGLVCYIEC